MHDLVGLLTELASCRVVPSPLHLVHLATDFLGELIPDANYAALPSPWNCAPAILSSQQRFVVFLPGYLLYPPLGSSTDVLLLALRAAHNVRESLSACLRSPPS